MLEQDTNLAEILKDQGVDITEAEANVLSAASRRWKEKVRLSTNKTRETRELLRSWMRASARQRMSRPDKETTSKARPITSRGRQGVQDMTCAKPARPKWSSRRNYALVSEQSVSSVVEFRPLWNEVRFQTMPAIQRWVEATKPDLCREEVWEIRSRKSWSERLARWLSEIGLAFVNLEQLHIAARSGLKVERWSLQNQRIPTITTTRSWGTIRLSETGEVYINRIDARTGLRLMGCAENSPLMAALEAMTACAQMTAVGNGMQLDVAMGIARKALGSVDVSGRRVRYADANSGIGFFAEAIRLVTGGEMEYVFRAEASPAIARGHDAAWARTGVARFSSSHLQQDVDSMVALGQVDIWQISPACYPITRNNRSPASAREIETEEMLVQLACALAYVTRAEPRMVIIEDVVELTKGLVWQRVRHLLPGQYNWTADVIDPIKHGGTAARERAWVVGELRHPTTRDFTGTSSDARGSDS